MSSSPLAWLVPFPFDTDDREPVFVFRMFGDTFGLYLPSVIFWMQVLGVVFLQAILRAILSIWTYQYVIKNKSSTHYLVGFGIIIPFWIVLPSFELQVLDIQNKLINFCLAAIIPTMAIFQTTEGMKRALQCNAMKMYHKLTNSLLQQCLIVFQRMRPSPLLPMHSTVHLQ